MDILKDTDNPYRYIIIRDATKSDRSSGFSGERPEAISLAAVSLRRQTACVLFAASSVGRNFLPAIIFTSISSGKLADTPSQLI